MEVTLVGDNIRAPNVSLDKVNCCGESPISAAWNVLAPNEGWPSSPEVLNIGD
jgi:hypothetical protein